MKKLLILLCGILGFATVSQAASILFYGPSIQDGVPNEETIAQDEGHSTTLVDGATWAAMTANEFAAFDAIVFGDLGCSSNFTTVHADANSNKSVWSPVVSGSVFIHTFDPFAHDGSDPEGLVLVANGINYVASGGGTGMSFSLGCFDEGGGSIDVLSEFGNFEYTSPNQDDAEIVLPAHPTMAGLTSEDLSDWGESSHENLSVIPDNFEVIVRDMSDPDLAWAVARIESQARPVPTIGGVALVLLIMGMFGIALRQKNLLRKVM